MSSTNFNKSILENYENFDAFVYKYKADTELFDLLYSIRMTYSVHTVLKTFRNTNKAKRYFTVLLLIFWRLLKPLLFTVQLTNKTRQVILYYWSKNEEMASNVGIECSYFKTDFSISFKRLYLYPKIFKIIILLFNNSLLNKLSVFENIPNIIEAVCTFYEINLNGIDLIITENDTHPQYVAVLSKAKQKGIKTVKIESVLIGDIQHNNVFCDYYFYPSNFHKNVRKKFEVNTNLKYIEGGFLNWDNLAKYKHQPANTPKIVTYFTAHSRLTGDYTDNYYIDEIISVLPDNYQLYIKIHPRENRALYKKYQDNQKCVVLPVDTDNFELICKSSFCISVFSSLSLEAKHIMLNSFFINYTPLSKSNVISYTDFMDYFNVITSTLELSEFLNNEKQAYTQSVFSDNFNMKYPNVCKSFKQFLKTI